MCDFTSSALVTLLHHCCQGSFFLPAVAIVTWDTEYRGSFMVRHYRGAYVAELAPQDFKQD